MASLALLYFRSRNVAFAFNGTGGWKQQNLNNTSTSDRTLVTGNIGLVALPGDDRVHAFSALTGAWSSLTAGGLVASDPIQISGSVAFVYVAAGGHMHAFNAANGQWTSLQLPGIGAGSTSPVPVDLAGVSSA